MSEIPSKPRKVRSVEQRLEMLRDQQARLERRMKDENQRAEVDTLVRIGRASIAAFALRETPELRDVLSNARASAANPDRFLQAYKRLKAEADRSRN